VRAPSAPIVTEEPSADWKLSLDLAFAEALRANETAAGDRFTQEFERQLILTALRHTGGRRVESAGWLGWGRNTITRKIAELNLEPELARRGL
jgi:two-component system, NtrC family, nitrogen regulation response regulator GlnG